MASIKGLLSLFFNGAPPPPQRFVQYTSGPPRVQWITTDAETAWISGPVTPNS